MAREAGTRRERAVSRARGMSVLVKIQEIDLAAIDLAVIDLAVIDLAVIDLVAIDLAAIDLAATDPAAIDLAATDPAAIDNTGIKLHTMRGVKIDPNSPFL